MLCVSLIHDGTHRPFSDRDFRQLERTELVVRITALQQGTEESAFQDHFLAQTLSDTGLYSRISSAFDDFGSHKLTAREREVVRMVLRGHSSESIGRHCGANRHREDSPEQHLHKARHLLTV